MVVKVYVHIKESPYADKRDESCHVGLFHETNCSRRHGQSWPESAMCDPALRDSFSVAEWTPQIRCTSRWPRPSATWRSGTGTGPLGRGWPVRSTWEIRSHSCSTWEVRLVRAMVPSTTFSATQFHFRARSNTWIFRPVQKSTLFGKWYFFSV